MRKSKFYEIIRDDEVSHAIHPVVRKYLMTWEETTAALVDCEVSRARNVAYIATRGFFSAPAIPAKMEYLRNNAGTWPVTRSE